MSDPEQDFREEMRLFIQSLDAKGYGPAIRDYFMKHPRFDEVPRDDVIEAVQQFTHAMSEEEEWVSGEDDDFKP
jgi:hypothetical protein